MTASMGRITARLAEPNEPVPSHLVTLINKNVQPPEPVTGKDVYIRSMYIVSDRVNSFGGRFPVEEHQRLAELLVDSPVMVGHRKDKLPVGRNFHAVTTERDDLPWVRSYFYWLRSAEGAEHLAENIDGGIYKECSVAFTFSRPECSICGRDIRLCPHQPLEKYSRHGRKEVCHFNYRQIERVLETSLVYRGAVPETAMSKELAAKEKATLSELDTTGRYLIIPRYDAVEVDARVANGKLVLLDPDGSPLGKSIGYEYQPAEFTPTGAVRGLVVGYRGKDRCASTDTRKYIEQQTGLVSRLVLNVLPDQGIDKIPDIETRSGLDVRLIPHRVVAHDQINRAALEIKTREGVELWPADEDPTNTARKVYHPSVSDKPPNSFYSLQVHQNNRQAVLCFRNVSEVEARSFLLPDFDADRLAQGRWLAAWPAEDVADIKPAADSGNALLSIESVDKALRFRTEGTLDGEYLLRPMKMDGRRGYLLRRTSEAAR